MFHHLRTEDAVQRGFGQVFQIHEQVRGFGIEGFVAAGGHRFLGRSEERRVGEKGRFRGAPDHLKKKKKKKPKKKEKNEKNRRRHIRFGLLRRLVHVH